MPKKRRVETDGLQSLHLDAATPSQGDAVQPLSYRDVNSGISDYVVDLAASTTLDYVAAGLASTGASVLKIANDRFETVSQAKLHTAALSCVRFDPEDPAVLLSCGFDGSVKAWDSSADVCSLELDARDSGVFKDNIELNCLDKCGHIIAAGSDGVVTFWDDRKPNEVLQRFADTHEKRVTQVRWHPGEQKFLSASEDGLISVFSTRDGLDEDDGFEAALNLMDSVSRIGFHGESRHHLWCTTSTESFYTWDWHAACQEDDEGGEGPSMSCTDVRQQLNPGMNEEEDLPDSSLSTILDLSENENGRLRVTCSAQDGSFALLPLKQTESTCRLQKKKSVAFSGGHSGAVRSILHGVGQHRIIVTGSEDGRIAVWPQDAPQITSGIKRKK